MNPQATRKVAATAQKQFSYYAKKQCPYIANKDFGTKCSPKDQESKSSF